MSREVNSNYHNVACICEECEKLKITYSFQDLNTAIKEFCKKSEWAAESWKAQPHIAKLFEIARNT